MFAQFQSILSKVEKVFYYYYWRLKCLPNPREMIRHHELDDFLHTTNDWLASSKRLLEQYFVPRQSA